MISRHTLVSYALLQEARSDASLGFSLAPFLRLALDPQRGQFLDVQKAAAFLRPLLGDGFTTLVIDAHVPLLEDLGWIEKVADRDDGAAIFKVTGVPPVESDILAPSAEENLREVVDALVSYIEETEPLFAFNMNRTTLSQDFADWATALDGQDRKEILKAVDRLLAGKSLTGTLSTAEDASWKLSTPREQALLFAGFVKYANRSLPDIFDKIIPLVEVGFVIDVVQSLQSPERVITYKPDVTFVLDGPVILDLVGLSGPSRQEAMKHIINAASQLGIRSVTLSHCLDEAREVVRAVLALPAADRHGLTGDALRANRTLTSYAQEFIRAPDRAVQTEGIQVLSFSIEANPNSFEWFPSTAFNEFRSRANFHGFGKYVQKERDSKSIAFIMRRRAGAVSSDWLNSKFVLIARNSTFVSFAQKFCFEKGFLPDYAAGPAVEQKTLAAIMWLRGGSEAALLLPRHQLLASCDRLLQSTKSVVAKAHGLAKRLEGAKSEQLELILSSSSIIEEITIRSGGNASYVDTANADEMLKMLKQSMAKAERLASKQVLQEAVLEGQAAIDEERLRLSELQTKNAVQAVTLQNRERELENVSTNLDRIRTEAYVAITSSAAKRRKFVQGIASFLLALLVTVSFLGLDAADLLAERWRLVGYCVVAVGYIFSLSTFFVPNMREVAFRQLGNWAEFRSIKRQLAALPSEDLRTHLTARLVENRERR